MQLGVSEAESSVSEGPLLYRRWCVADALIRSHHFSFGPVAVPGEVMVKFCSGQILTSSCDVSDGPPQAPSLDVARHLQADLLAFFAMEHGREELERVRTALRE